MHTNKRFVQEEEYAEGYGREGKNIPWTFLAAQATLPLTLSPVLTVVMDWGLGEVQYVKAYVIGSLEHK